MRQSQVLLYGAVLALGGCSAVSSLFDRQPQQSVAASPTQSQTSQSPQRPGARAQPIAATGRTGAFTTRPGGVYENSYGNTLTVTNVWGHYIEFRDQQGNEYLSYALLYTPDTKLRGSEHVMQAIDSLWPLATGKSAEAWVYNAEWAWKLSWRVLGQERVQVPAGTFDAWLIEHTEESLQGGYVGKSRSWYAPSIGWNVRHSSWQQFPYSPKAPEEWELTAVPSGGAPASARAQ